MQITKQRRREYDAFYKKTGVRLGAPPVMRVETDLEERIVGRAKAACTNGTIDDLPEIMLAVKVFPNEPVFLNYLSVAYGRLQMKKEMRATIEKSYRLFPDYPFAKLAKVMTLLEDEQPHEAAMLLGEIKHIHKAFPEKKVVDESLFCQYAIAATRIALALDDYDTAQMHNAHMKEIFPAHPNTELIRKYLVNFEMKRDIAAVGTASDAEPKKLDIKQLKKYVNVIQKYSGEFGINTPDTDHASASIPKEMKQQYTNIAQNANCPCGSGKKYKRCCGA
jgi:SEC-C motif